MNARCEMRRVGHRLLRLCRPLVWRIDLDAPTLQDRRRLAWLGAEERKRYDRFCYARDAARYLAAHVALRDILGQLLRRRPETLEFTRTRYGKPMLSDSPLAFSLSHSSGVALVAVAPGPTVGVDVECGDLSSHTGLVEAIAGPAELARVERLSNREFRWLWTAKEAVLKAYGTGLHTDPRDVAVPLSRPTSATMSISRHAGRVSLWRVHNLAASGFGGALALPASQPAASPFAMTYRHGSREARHQNERPSRTPNWLKARHIRINGTCENEVQFAFYEIAVTTGQPEARGY